MKVTNWFGFNDANSQQFYKVAQFSPGWWTLMANLAAVMAEHRQNVVITPLMNLIEPRVEGGRLVYDFANFDRWVETFQRAGAIGYIEGAHLLGRARKLRCRPDRQHVSNRKRQGGKTNSASR